MKNKVREGHMWVSMVKNDKGGCGFCTERLRVCGKKFGVYTAKDFGQYM